MLLRDEGLIARRGITLPLTVTESIGAEELLEKAVVKGFTYSPESGIRNLECEILKAGMNQNMKKQINKYPFNTHLIFYLQQLFFICSNYS